MLDQVANQVLLSSCASIRLAGQAAVWASSRLRLMCTASTFPLQVTTTSGHNVTVDAVRNQVLLDAHMNDVLAVCIKV